MTYIFINWLYRFRLLMRWNRVVVGSNYENRYVVCDLLKCLLNESTWSMQPLLETKQVIQILNVTLTPLRCTRLGSKCPQVVVLDSLGLFKVCAMLRRYMQIALLPPIYSRVVHHLSWLFSFIQGNQYYSMK